ncbi:hypothetical protein QBC46DRAFT_437210 [Diplogelasinospora grovesii]|uniref:Alpha-galactosidase A n=1 Tax=Diplogelasinospora grovesii TaxID=303347 RepID=A0AAN6N763_9PEZI|nr:hypothetical protein QBC46DRAFT_437210 [Diplogelasinospora grovesii]
MTIYLVISADSSVGFYSYYRIRLGDRVKYVVVAPRALDKEELWLPLYYIPPLPYDRDDWTIAHIGRDAESGELKFSLENRNLVGVEEIWHPEMIDCLVLERTRLLSPTVEECIRKDRPGAIPLIAKIAAFEWQMPLLVGETHAYRLLEGTGIAPRFLGHIHERGRVIGVLLEKAEGRFAGIEDLPRCEEILSRLHAFGLLHGDPNRYNFVINGNDEIKLIDFEKTRFTEDSELMRAELASLPKYLVDESGRGGGFVTMPDEEEDGLSTKSHTEVLVTSTLGN